MDKLKTLAAAFVLIGVLFLAFAPDSIWGGGGMLPEAKRKAAGDFTLQTLDGGRWSLAEQRGKVVLVNYWATWCPPCRTETPGLVRLANEYRSRGLEVAGIALDEDRNLVREFAVEYKISYPILLPAANSNLPQMIESIPVTLLYDWQGRMAKRYVGAVSESTFKADVEQLLAERGDNANN